MICLARHGHELDAMGRRGWGWGEIHGSPEFRSVPSISRAFSRNVLGLISHYGPISIFGRPGLQMVITELLIGGHEA